MRIFQPEAVCSALQSIRNKFTGINILTNKAKEDENHQLIRRTNFLSFLKKKDRVLFHTRISILIPVIERPTPIINEF